MTLAGKQTLWVAISGQPQKKSSPFLCPVCDTRRTPKGDYQPYGFGYLPAGRPVDEHGRPKWIHCCAHQGSRCVWKLNAEFCKAEWEARQEARQRTEEAARARGRGAARQDRNSVSGGSSSVAGHGRGGSVAALGSRKARSFSAGDQDLPGRGDPALAPAGRPFTAQSSPYTSSQPIPPPCSSAAGCLPG